jgi:hypothetical protein
MAINIILSCSDDDIYRDFWPVVSWAYKKIIPDCTVHLAFLTYRDPDDELLARFRSTGHVFTFTPVVGIPHFSQAKMIRFILASKLEGVNYIDDIDLLPMNKDFITYKTDNRKEGHLLCVGGEVYGYNGCYPVSQMTAERSVWKELINPDEKTIEELWHDWSGPVMFDRRENPLIDLDWDKDSYFSDERLIRRLRHGKDIPIHEMERGYKNFMEATMDRYQWVLDPQKLNDNVYVNAHCTRPYNPIQLAPLVQYIEQRYQ